MNVPDLSIDKVPCCYFNEENLQVIDVKEDLKNTTGSCRSPRLFSW